MPYILEMENTPPLFPQSHLPPSQPPSRRRRFPVVLTILIAFVAMGMVAAIAVPLIAVAWVNNPKVSKQSVLKMRLRGEIPEDTQLSWFEFLGARGPVTILEHVTNLRAAARDDRIKGVFMEIGPLGIGFGKIEELRDAIVEFKKSGKFVIAYAEALAEREYALAIAANEIYMPPDAYFEFNGFATTSGHYPGVLEKLGIDVQYFRFGKYKSASGEKLGRKAFSEPVKEMITSNMELVFSNFVAAVASHRDLSPEAVRALINEAQPKSEWALQKHLIDGVAYIDEVEQKLAQKSGRKEGEKPEVITAGGYRRIKVPEANASGTIAVIHATGLIVAGEGSANTQGSEPIIAAFRSAVEDKSVKAIVFRVDSPGGAGLGCDYVRREVAIAAAKKPVIVSMSDVAASGGYWVSMAATAIVAHPSTATGSIGIFSVVPNLANLYEKINFNLETFKIGEHADAFRGSRRLTEAEAKQFDAALLTSYQRFVALAAEGRKMTPEAMEEVAQGRTWFGVSALRRGLIDALGGYPKAIALAKEKASLPADRPVRVEDFTVRKSPFEQLRDMIDESHDQAHSGAMTMDRLLAALPLGAQFPWFAPFAAELLRGRETLFPLMEYPVDYR